MSVAALKAIARQVDNLDAGEIDRLQVFLNVARQAKSDEAKAAGTRKRAADELKGIEGLA